MTISARFWDAISARYERTPVADQVSYQKKLQTTQSYLRPEMDVLELGCGTGSTALAHAPFVKHVHATDLSAKMLGIARTKADSASVSNITFEQGEVSELKVVPGQYDVVLALSVLHLLGDYKGALASAHTALKPGGLIVTSTACLADTQNYFRPLAWAGRLLRVLPHLTFFRVNELRQDFVDAGFEIEHEWQSGRGKAVFIIGRKAA
jgi:2-polyprenyl-3-methyl-5-hydroxy-6-metoxy-1,4-benzoquinol methylase